MSSNFSNIIKGAYNRLKRSFYRPYSTFDIGWVKEKILKHQTDLNLKYHIYKDKYKIAFRDSPVFLVSIDELFINEFYKFRSLSDSPRIIDCGSYIGTSILYFKVNYPNSKITGFEPDPSNFSVLKSNLEEWNFPNAEVINAAIWTNNESISFSAKGGMASRIETDTSAKETTNKVKCVRLRDLLHEEVDFLKIDIEGAEHAVLMDCADYLSKVKNLFVEYHGIYSESYKLNDILNILIRNNFKYYIKEGSSVYQQPFWQKDKIGEYDMILNIFAFRDQGHSTS